MFVFLFLYRVRVISRDKHDAVLAQGGGCHVFSDSDIASHKQNQASTGKLSVNTRFESQTPPISLRVVVGVVLLALAAFPKVNTHC